MRNRVEQISVTELVFFLIGALLIVVFAAVLARGQSAAPPLPRANAHAQVQQPLYREYRGVHLGMTAAEVRAKLGEPALKSDEQDFYIISPTETAQFAYDAALKVVTISTDYTSGAGAPDYKNVVGEGVLLERPNGSLFRMVMYDSERFWVSYSKSATIPIIVTITISAYK